MQVHRWLGGLALVAMLGCAETGSEEAASEADIETSSPLGAAQPLWDDYVREVTANPIQEGCKPIAAMPPAGTYKGVALLFHGYSACPQQFDELIPKLTASGFVVLAALLPGHGRVATEGLFGKTLDVTPDLPDDANHKAYGSLAKRMASLVAAAPAGKNVVLGLSVGGAMAASATAQGPGVFGRSLLLNPFFDAASPVRQIVPAINWLAPKMRIGWGAGCEVERAGGRAGFCGFQVTNLKAARQFGLESLAAAGTIATETLVVGVEDDGAARPSAVAKAASTIPGAQGCFFEKGVPHSILSRKDNPTESKYWLPATLAQINRYLATGQMFDVVGESAYPPFGRCRSR